VDLDPQGLAGRIKVRPVDEKRQALGLVEGHGSTPERQSPPVPGALPQSGIFIPCRSILSGNAERQWPRITREPGPGTGKNAPKRQIAGYCCIREPLPVGRAVPTGDSNGPCYG